MAATFFSAIPRKIEFSDQKRIFQKKNENNVDKHRPACIIGIQTWYGFFDIILRYCFGRDNSLGGSGR